MNQQMNQNSQLLPPKADDSTDKERELDLLMQKVVPKKRITLQMLNKYLRKV